MITITSLTQVSQDGRNLGTVVDALAKLGPDKRGEILDALLAREKDQAAKSEKATADTQKSREAEREAAAKESVEQQAQIKELTQRLDKASTALTEARGLNSQITGRLAKMLEDDKIDNGELAELHTFATAPAKNRAAAAKKAQAATLLEEAAALEAASL